LKVLHRLNSFPPMPFVVVPGRRGGRINPFNSGILEKNGDQPLRPHRQRKSKPLAFQKRPHSLRCPLSRNSNPKCNPRRECFRSESRYSIKEWQRRNPELF
jgi:hypothetical protein